MTTFLLILATLSLLIFLNALYVAAEFGTVSSRRTRISQLATEGNRFARLLRPIVEDSKRLDRYVAACQVGITASSLILGAFGQGQIATRLVGPIDSALQFVNPVLDRAGVPQVDLASGIALTIAVTVVLLILTLLQVVLGELFPKSVAVQYPERVALSVVVPVRWSMAVMRPVIWLLNGSGTLLLRLLKVNLDGSKGRVHSPEEIELLVTESHEGGLLDDEERLMLRNAFRLRDLTARQVMLHRTKITAAPVDTPVKELLELALGEGHTRIPLYHESIDDILGFVHIKDLFKLYMRDNDNLAEILREVIQVPETIPVVDVWETLSSKRQYLAIVFDEFGGTAGLITFEDLIEEIVGELQDEFDDETALIALDAEGRMYLRGDLLVVDVNEYLQLQLPDTADTLGGFVLSQLGRPPQVGDEVTVGETTIRVEVMENLSVLEVSLQTPQTNVSPVHVGEWEVGEHD